MKTLLLLLLVTSCALPLQVRNKAVKREVKEVRAVDKLHKCVVELVSIHSVKAETAERVCSRIFKRGE